ncbi:MAG: RecQ family ATP-dependent DNA helicase, partial [Phycisphaerales bacterium]|nr:RecQ family ATP-dependent DNA helicase [Phycisphaerales bacterium]
PEEQSDLLRSLADGSLRLLLAAPERAVTPRFLQHLRDANLGAIAIDEAHCISHWGHDFRPEYRRMAELREWFPDVPVHCYTATATERVRRDIVEQMGMDEAQVLVGNFDRPNLTYRVERRRGVEKQIAHELKSVGDEAAIVYCISRRNTETIAAKLRNLGFHAEAYHAGLDAEVRRDIQDRFTREELNIVVATVAFGMGIDRSNVRLVAHAAMPKSLEAYQQETGRAGRDGLPSTCLMLCAPGDAGKWAGLMRRSAAEAEVDDAVVRAQLALLGEMTRYSTRMVCRHRQLAEHFGQSYDPPCHACDVCNGQFQVVRDETVAPKILSCIARTGQRYGTGHVVDVLRGADTQRIRDLGHDRLKSHGT